MAGGAGKPIGAVTRGTTNTNRLRRCDRWLAAQPILRNAADPLIVDLGYGANGSTTLELEARLHSRRAEVEVLGLEIESSRVATAREQLRAVRAGATGFRPDARVGFERGGFEVPMPTGRRAAVIRAFNVLRQYDEREVDAAWRLVVSRLQTDGMLVDGTCDELGRIAAWVRVGRDGPVSLTISLRLAGLEHPSIVAERLPKVLIHRNVAGEPVHELMRSLDREWAANAGLGAFGPRQRWIATARALRGSGWPVRGGSDRWRLGELTVDWAAVAPTGYVW